MEIFNYLKESLHIDPIIVLIVIGAGLFAKKYLKVFSFVKKDSKTDNALKTLVVSFVISMIYLILIGTPREMWAQYFLSYFLATSLYELIFYPIISAIKTVTGADGKNKSDDDSNG